MKVVLSRKGFDSEYGGYPSPILPDGRMISLPISFQSTKPIAYSQLKLENDKTYFDLMRQLNDKIHVKNEGEKGKWIELTTDTQCHLDPDIYKNVMKRPKDWKSLFGQIDAAQSHLKNNKVDAGDIFLFFGTFRKMKFSQDGKLGYDSTDKRKHIVSGYLQIGEIIRDRIRD